LAGWVLLVTVVLLAVAGVAAAPLLARPIGWQGLSWLPVPPAVVVVCITAAVLIVVVWVLRRLRPRLAERERPWVHVAVSAGLAAAEALLLGAVPVAVNAATAHPPGWPAWLAGRMVRPVPALGLLIAAAVVLAWVLWEARPAPVQFRRLFATPALAHSPASLLRADLAVVRFRGEGRHGC
jgi:hypothetical protein